MYVIILKKPGGVATTILGGLKVLQIGVLLYQICNRLKIIDYENTILSELGTQSNTY